MLFNQRKLMGVRYHKKMRGEIIYGTLTNEQSYLFSSIYTYCVLHFVPWVSIVMAALHEKNVSLIQGPSRLAGLSCYLLSITGRA